MSLIARVKNILFQPKQEWGVIDHETATPASLYTGYILPLAAIGPVASVIGLSVFGMHMPFSEGVIRIPLGSMLTHAIVMYVLTLVNVFILALIINALATTFGGQKNSDQALKLVTYSSTAAWVAGIFSIIPALSVLTLLGLYSLYLLYTGLPVLMKAPKEKALGYTIVVVLVSFVLYVVIGVISGGLIAPQMDFSTMPGMPQGGMPR
jgi:hypothetical protein